MPGHVLDTDTFTLFRRGQAEVVRRVLATDPDRLAVTVITLDESLSGWHAAVRRPLPPEVLAQRYGQLADTVRAFHRFRIENFTVPAIAVFEQLRRLKINVGANDLRIAAIALTVNAVVATRNRRDFERVPGLRLEDWATPLAGPPAAG